MRISTVDAGKKFGSLTAVSVSHSDKHGGACWIFKCDCGNNHTARMATVKQRTKSGNPATPSCGCVRRSIGGKHTATHGYSGTKLYFVYMDMMKRCYNKNNASYHLYGGNGVTVCDKWKNDIESFMEWANNTYSEGMVLDKDILCRKMDISPKVYSPETCQWITQADNIRDSSNRGNYGANKHIKLSKDDVSNIVTSHDSGAETATELANRFNVSLSWICQIIKKNKQ